MKSPQRPPTIARPLLPLTAPVPAHTRADLRAAQSSAVRSQRQQTAAEVSRKAAAERGDDRRHALRMRSISDKP